MALVDAAYKWCPRCSGSIRDEATYCRFCKNELLSPESKAKVAFFGPENKFDTARRWVPNLDYLVARLKDSRFQDHILEGMEKKGKYAAAFAALEQDPGMEQQLNESNVGLERPPFEQEMNILWDVFVHLYDEGYDLVPALDTAKLRVLGITVDKVQKEHIRRLEAEAAGRWCPFCKEPNLVDAKDCIACTSDFEKPPKREPKRFKRGVIGFFPLDYKLMQSVLTHIAVNEALAGEPWRTKLGGMLQKYEVADATVEEALRQRQYLLTEDMEVPLPISEWQQKLLSEGLDDGMHGYHAVHNIIELGQTCVAEERYPEAELVLNFAMACADNCLLGNISGLDAMREPLKTSGWLALSQLYEVTGRYEEAEKAHSEMFQTRLPMPIPGLDEIMKATMDLLSPQRLMRQADLCFKQAKFDEAVSLYKRALDSLDIQESKPFAGLANLAALLGGEKKDNPMEELAAFSDTEQSKLQEMSELVMVSTAHRVGLLKKLAEVYIAQKDMEQAQSMLDQATDLCEQLSGTYQALVADVAQKSADLNCMLGKYREARPLFELALEFYATVKDPLDPEEYARVVSSTHEQFADCLDKLNLKSEAEEQRRQAREVLEGLNL